MLQLNQNQQKLIYSIFVLVLLTLSFFSGRLSKQIEYSQAEKPIKVIEDLNAPGTLDDLLELIKKDHAEPCPVCECESLAAGLVPAESGLVPAENTAAPLVGAVIEGPFVASKSSSSKKFHASDSSTAKRIKDENKVYFQTKEEAIAAGYTPGSSVK